MISMAAMVLALHTIQMNRTTFYVFLCVLKLTVFKVWPHNHS